MEDKTHQMMRDATVEAALKAGHTAVKIILQRMGPDGEYEQLIHTEALHPRNAGSLYLVSEYMRQSAPAQVFFVAAISGIQSMLKEIASTNLTQDRQDWRTILRGH